MPNKLTLPALLFPLLALGLFIFGLTQSGRLMPSHDALPPIEGLTVERVVVSDHEVELKIRAEGAHGLLVAQVAIDGAYWVFHQAPEGRLRRGESAVVRIAFPWVAGETHHIRLLTDTGATFDHSLDIAAITPQVSLTLLLQFALLGALIGIIPVAIGIGFFPALTRLGASGLEFLLALTTGLLVYLFFDMVLEGFELATKSSAVFGGALLVILPLLATTAVLLAVSGRSRGSRSAARLAVLVALAIGVHNFGEGLAVGASIANNEITLGVFLIVGFALHNVTEGIGIVAPLSKQTARWPMLFGLAALAGLPAIPGIWLSALAYSPHFGAIFFGVGAGAVLQVVIELDRFMRSQSTGESARSRFSRLSVAGYCAGALLMYATALLITI